jgi:hypothetical protein
MIGVVTMGKWDLFLYYNDYAGPKDDDRVPSYLFSRI